MRHHPHRTFCLFVLCVGLAQSGVLADGGYFPETAFPTLPKIPAQRALIAFREGIETLVVESAVSTDSPGVGWVLPLPAPPTEIEVVSPGALKTLSFCLYPELVHDIGEWAHLGAALLFFLVFYLGARTCRDATRARQLTLLLIFLIVVLAGMLLPALGTGGASSAQRQDAIRIHEEVDTGPYHVTVLTAEGAGDLDTWLRENGLAGLSAEAGEIVTKYIASGWCFCVTRLARPTGGASTPAPLKVTFPAESPVYPLRLTRLAGSTVYLELFVAADEEAACAELKREFVDRFKTQRSERWYWLEELHETPPTTWHKGTETWCEIGHPEIVPLLWDRCVVTKLSGNITPDQMQDDIVLRLTNARPYRRVVFSRKGTAQTAICIFSFGLVALTLVSMVVWRNRLDPGPGIARFLQTVFAPLVLVMLTISSMFWALWPTVEVQAGSRPRSLAQSQALAVSEAAARLPPDTRHALADADIEAIASSLDEALSDLENPFLRERVRREASPGNYTVTLREGRPVILVYDHIGCELPITLPVTRAREE